MEKCYKTNADIKDLADHPQCVNKESNHAVLKNRFQSNGDTATHINISFLPTGSTVVVECENGGLCAHGLIIGHRSEDHN